MENQSPNNHSVETLLISALDRAGDATRKQIRRAEVYTRESPASAIFIAAATGYVLRSLPLFALARLFLRVALVLVRPFIFLFGAASLYHFITSRAEPGEPPKL
jgi:hypothetical protein